MQYEVIRCNVSEIEKTLNENLDLTLVAYQQFEDGEAVLIFKEEVE